MAYLSRMDIERLSQRIIKKYRRSPEMRYQRLDRIDPEHFLSYMLKLNIEYEHLSRDRRTLGLTTSGETGVGIYDGDGNKCIYMLDGQTVLIEKALLSDTCVGRKNFSIMHEGAHHILYRMFPKEYGITKGDSACVPVHYYRVPENRRPITDWVEWQSNTFASALLLPENIVILGMLKFRLGNKIEVLSRSCAPDTFQRFVKLSQYLGVSMKTLEIRMLHLGLLSKSFLNTPNDYMDIFKEE